MEDMGQNNQMDLKIDAEFRNLLPEPTSEEYTNLEKSIVKRGVMSPLLVWDGTIIDGHTRYAICQAHRMKDIPTKEISFQSRDEALAWILMNQLSRRNLTGFQKNEIALKYEKVIAKQMKKRQGERNDLKEHSDQLVKKLNPTSTRKELARIAGTSEGSILRTKTILDKGTPEQIERLRNGEASVYKIYKEIKEKGVPEGMKKCSRCGQILPLDHFYNKQAECRECHQRLRVYRDSKGEVIKTDDKYKDVSDQSIIDGLYKEEEVVTTIEDVVSEFMTNLRESMNNLAFILKVHSDIVLENQEQITSMFLDADREYQAMKEVCKCLKM